jgi:hypothetical protein
LNILEHTLLAYAFDTPAEGGRVERGLRRVGSHVQRLFAEPLEHHARCDSGLGLAAWIRADDRLRWPLWDESEASAVAWTSAPTGWARLVGPTSPERAASEAALALQADPSRLVDLNPPFVAAIRDGDSLAIVNDFIGVARLYEMRTPDGWVWSNRLAALSLFAGIAPEPDEPAWAILAAAGWFLGEHTPIRGCVKLPGATAIRAARAQDGGVEVERTRTDAPSSVLSPRGRFAKPASQAAIDEARDLADSVGQLWSVPPVVDLSGGRDSRVSAAAVVASGIDAQFRTGDIDPGETDVARTLIAASPRPLQHKTTHPEGGDPDDDLLERAANLHLIHDGARNPQSLLRNPIELPHEGHQRPVISGHGGELAHGFYYGTKKKLRSLGRARESDLVARLERTARKRHDAGREEVYDEYRGEVLRTLEAGRDLGLKGPNLLDYFYFAQRLANRSGLGTRNDRCSACCTSGFVRACFDLRPKDRLRAKLHREIVSGLVPQWGDIPFFDPQTDGAMPEINRSRLWERPSHAAAVEEVIANDGPWVELFDRERIREMWAEVRRGEGHHQYEAAFTRVVWRETFDGHLKGLAEEIANDAA